MLEGEPNSPFDFGRGNLYIDTIYPLDNIKHMSEITKEYFDKTIHGLKNDLQTEIKTEIGNLRTEFRTEIRTEIGGLRTEVGVLFEDVHDKLDLILEC